MLGNYNQITGTPTKLPCKVAVSVGIILGNPVTVLDGINIYTGDRILLFGQLDGRENGIYVLNNLNRLDRTSDFTYNADVYSGLQVFINQGTYALKTFVLTTTDPIILSQTTLTFSIYTSGGGSGGSGTSGTSGTSGSSGAGSPGLIMMYTGLNI